MSTDLTVRYYTRLHRASTFAWAPLHGQILHVQILPMQKFFCMCSKLPFFSMYFIRYIIGNHNIFTTTNFILINIINHGSNNCLIPSAVFVLSQAFPSHHISPSSTLFRSQLGLSSIFFQFFIYSTTPYLRWARRY